MIYRFFLLILVLSANSFSELESKNFEINNNEDKSEIIIKNSLLNDNLINQYFDISYDSLASNYILNFKYAADENHKIKLQPEIKFQNKLLGFRRNIPIYELQIPLTNSFDSIIVSIEYSKRANQTSEIEFYDLVNAEFANSFKKTSFKISQDKPQSNSWFNPELEHVLIETNQDGLVIFNAWELDDYFPDIMEKYAEHFHLMYKGKKYPIYIDGGRLNSTTYFVFAGKKGRSDTTYYDFYTPYEAFYLYYDESEENELIQSSDEWGRQYEAIESVHIDKFIQIKEQYYDGHSYLSEKVPTEGWMSLFIHPNQGRRTFEHYVGIVPSPNPEDEITFKLNYLALGKISSAESERDYSLSLLINGKKYSDTIFTGRTFGTLEAKLKSNEILAGVNKIQLVSNSPENATQAGYTAVTSIEVSGKQIPVLENNVINISTESDTNTVIQAWGFTKDFNLMLDTISNTIIDAGSAQNESKFILNAVNNENLQLLAYQFDDKIFYSETDDYLFGYIKPDTIIAESFSKSEASDIIKFLQSFPKDTVNQFAAIINPQNIDATIVNELKKMGAEFNAQSDLWIWYNYSRFSNYEISGTNIITLDTNVWSDTKRSHRLTFLKGKQHNFVGNANVSSNNFKLSEVSGILPSEKIDDSDVVLISHQDFLEKAEEYKAYRESNTEHKIHIVDVQDIYKEYNYGKISPYAIKDYLRENYAKNPNLEYVILFGDASWDPNKFLDFSISTNYIPVYGFPYSDYWYGLLDDDYEFELKVGRIPINNRQEFDSYMQKLKVHDSIPARKWMKDFLLLSGGENGTERRNFKNFSLGLAYDYILPKSFRGDTTVFAKQDEAPGSEVLGSPIREEINKGKLWTTFLGHAAADVYDLEGWQAERLNNKNRYGILSTLSCNTGDFANPLLKRPRNEAYIMEPDKGFVISMGSTTSGFVAAHSRLLEYMLKSVTDDEMKFRNISDILYYGKSRLFTQAEFLYTRMHYALLGDPLLNIRVSKEPEPFITTDDLLIIPENGNQISDQDENVMIKAKLHNNGICLSEPFNVLLTRRYGNQTDSLWIEFAELCYADSIEVSLPVSEMKGTHYVEVIISPDITIAGDNIENNQISFTFEVLSQGLSPLEPLANWNMNVNDLSFRVIAQLNDENSASVYKFVISEDNQLSQDEIYYSATDEISVEETHIEWIPQAKLDKGESYWFGAWYDNSDGSQSEILWIPFNTYSDNINENASWQISSSDEFNSNQISGLHSFSFDNNESLKILDKNENVHIISYSGNPALGETNHSYVTIDVDNNTYVDGFYLRGFNLVTVPVQNNGKIGKIKRFDTWGNDLSYGSDWWRDSVAIDLVNYLRDSVSNDEYLLVGTCNAVWRMPLNHKLDPSQVNRGSLDTLRDEFNEFGSALIDSVKGVYDFYNTAWKHAFAMVGRKGMPYGSIIEGMSPETELDSVEIFSDITRYSEKGDIVLKKFGPAKVWNNILIEGYLPPAGFEMNVQIFGESKSGEMILLIEESNKLKFSLLEISAEEYPFLFAKIELIRNNYDLDNILSDEFPYINSINADFIPAAELAILNSSFILSHQKVLRGEELTVSVRIKNISKRSTSPAIPIILRLSNPDLIDYPEEIPALVPDEIYEYSKTINTSSLNGKVQLSLLLDNDRIYNELYSFNNTFASSFEVYQDTVPPVISLKVDDKFVYDGDFVQIKPKLQISITDNSPLAINDVKNILVFINGQFTDEKNSELFEFKSYENGELKAELEVIPNFNLEYGDDEYLPANSIRIIAFDATGNSDTLRVLVNVSKNAFISNLINYPNPLSNETTFSFDYRANDNSAKILLAVFDSHGRLVDEFSQVATVGKNEIIWQAKNSSNNSLSGGVYVYRITLDGYYTEPKFGKIIIIN